MRSQRSMPTLPHRLETLIERELRGRVCVSGFHVLIEDQGLILQGRVPSYYAKQLIQHLSMEASGLPILANEIEVR